ncbi:hypothetical protein IMG5_120510, partial [Ichthyophthirius multifiliis]
MKYQRGLEYFMKGKYRISHEFFLRSLENIKKQQQVDNQDYVLVLKNLVYKEYNNLFVYCLKYNLNKAILLGKALLSENERKKIPPQYQNLFTFNLGTAYLLKGNFVDSKQRLRECITSNPNILLKGQALNNLAVASWWHKNPNYQDSEIKDENGPYPSLKQQLEKKMEINYIAQLRLDCSLRFLENTTQQSQYIKQKQSGTPLFNIYEFLIFNKPQLVQESQFWFKQSLKFYESVDPYNMAKCVLMLGIFLSKSKE